jgi:phosphoribosylformimino-5-aminoimidazole carboxamide ribotide isomerase
VQIGGGIRTDSAAQYLEAGASHVIVTSYVFREGKLDRQRLKELVAEVGRENLVLDLSCRKQDGVYK